jgi:uncharacterized protein
MLQKIIILAAVIAAVWYGFKFVTRLDQQRKQKVAREKRDAVDDVSDTLKCPVCGTYVAAQSAGDCGESGCPYRSG